MGLFPILVSGQAGVVHDPLNYGMNYANLTANATHFGKQIAHYAKQMEHYGRQIDHYAKQIDYYKSMYDYQKLNATRLSNFDVGEITTTLRGLLNTVNSSAAEVDNTYGGRIRSNVRVKQPYKTIRGWERHSLQRMPEDFYKSKIATADSQMKAIQIALEFQKESQEQMKQDLKNLEKALNDVRTAQGQLQALQAGAKIAAEQAIALKQIITLLGMWMEMQAQRYVDQANKEAAQEAAWKKQTEFDPGDYVAQPMQLKIR